MISLSPKVEKIRRSPLGFTLVELIAAMAILMLLATVALPVATIQVQRTKEQELREDLRTMRDAIDRYKQFTELGLIQAKLGTFGYPPDLQTLVDGVQLKGMDAKYKFLRKIPVDPMTGDKDWGLRSMQDDPDSRSWGGEDVFDVYSKSTATALDGTQYDNW